MTLRTTSHSPAPPVTPVDLITALRLAHAAHRQVPGNLFRLLVDLSPTDAEDQAPPPQNEDADLGPPWDEDPITETAETGAVGPTGV